MTRRQRSVEEVAPWAVGLALATPVLVAFYPPMTDLPFHEAAVGMLRHFDDTSMLPAGLYRHNFGEPNQLFHMIGWALSYAVSTRWAVKLAVAASVVAIPVCAARFARHVGGSPLASVVVAPMALGWLFSWGLVANLMGLAALLAVLPALDRLGSDASPRRALAACAALVLLYFAHAAMLTVYAGAALALAALRRGSWRETLWRLSPFVGAVVVTLAQLRWQRRFMTPAVRGMPNLWHPVAHKLSRVPYIILPATEGPAKLGMFALCVIVVASFFWLRARERRDRRLGHPPPSGEGAAPTDAAPTDAAAADAAAAAQASRVERARAWALARRWELFAVACFGAYLAFPLSLSGATLVYQRFFPPAYAVLALTAAPRDLWSSAARATFAALAALPAATLFVAWPSFVDSSRQFGDLEPLIALVDPGSALAEVDLGPGEPWRTYSLGPAAGRIAATRGGRLAYSFASSPISPVVVERRYQWNESLIRIGFDSWQFRPAHDLRRFRYVLLRTTDPKLAWMATFALQAEAEYLAESGDWVLLRSRLPTIPLTSPDEKLESPPPESVRDRVNQIVAGLRERPTIDVPPEDGSRGDGALREGRSL